jgi:hypothetical protein
MYPLFSGLRKLSPWRPDSFKPVNRQNNRIRARQIPMTNNQIIKS